MHELEEAPEGLQEELEELEREIAHTTKSKPKAPTIMQPLLSLTENYSGFFACLHKRSSADDETLDSDSEDSYDMESYDDDTKATRMADGSVEPPKRQRIEDDAKEFENLFTQWIKAYDRSDGGILLRLRSKQKQNLLAKLKKHSNDSFLAKLRKYQK